MAGPAPRAELIRGTGRGALSLAVSSWRHISYFGSGRRELSRDHPAAGLCSLPGSLRESTEEQRQGPAPSGCSQHKGSPARDKCEMKSWGVDLRQTRAEVFVPALLKAFHSQQPSPGII